MFSVVIGYANPSEFYFVYIFIIKKQQQQQQHILTII